MQRQVISWPYLWPALPPHDHRISGDGREIRLRMISEQPSYHICFLRHGVGGDAYDISGRNSRKGTGVLPMPSPFSSGMKKPYSFR